MTFPAPESVAGEKTTSDESRLQFACDIGQEIARLDAAHCPPETFKQSADQLQRVLGRLHAATRERDYLDYRRNLVLLLAECYRTARDRGILTDEAAVAATDAVK